MSKSKNHTQKVKKWFPTDEIPRDQDINIFLKSILIGLLSQDENIRNDSIRDIKHIDQFVGREDMQLAIDFLLVMLINGTDPMSEQEKELTTIWFLNGTKKDKGEVKYSCLRALLEIADQIPDSKKEEFIGILLKCADDENYLIKQLSIKFLEGLADNKPWIPPINSLRNIWIILDMLKTS